MGICPVCDRELTVLLLYFYFVVFSISSYVQQLHLPSFLQSTVSVEHPQLHFEKCFWQLTFSGVPLFIYFPSLYSAKTVEKRKKERQKPLEGLGFLMCKK